MIALAAVVAFTVVTVAAGWLASRKPHRWFVDHSNERSLHDRPVSRAGGIAILAGMSAGLTTLAFIEAPMPGSGWILAGAIVIVSVSFADDLRRVSPIIRIVCHLAAGTCVALAGLSAEKIALPGMALHPGPGAGTAFTISVRGMVRQSIQFHGWDGRARGRYDGDRLHDPRSALRRPGARTGSPPRAWWW